MRKIYGGGKSVIRIAICDDEKEAADLFRQNLARYTAEHGVDFTVSHFCNAITFLENYKPVYDIVFMDIKMPDMDGLTAAKHLRKLDPSVILIFLTNLAQYAVNGYEVNALDFIIKPISYYTLVLKLERALDRLSSEHGIEVAVSMDDTVVKIRAVDLKYIEVQGHNLVFHTVKGDYKSYGTLKKIEEKLTAADFVRCNACYLVNMKYVTAIRGDTAYLGETELHISHSKRKDFVRLVNNYMGWCS